MNLYCIIVALCGADGARVQRQPVDLVLEGAGHGAMHLRAHLGWHYLSKATCLIRPRLFRVLLVASRVIIIC